MQTFPLHHSVHCNIDLPIQFNINLPIHINYLPINSKNAHKNLSKFSKPRPIQSKINSTGTNNQLNKTHFLKSDLSNFNKRKFDLFPFSTTYRNLAPFLEKEWNPILKGWMCSLVSVGSLYLAVPRIGDLSAMLASGNFNNFTKLSVFTVVLVAFRSISRYFEQAWLWEAALNTSCAIRIDVYQKVLNRNMSYFESPQGILTGDIAYRLTAEAKDTADIVYALLHSIVPTMLQLIAMATNMFSLNRTLASATILVIPCMSIAIRHFGKQLHWISRMSQDSVAAISAYLNEVLPSVMVVKAYGAEDCEFLRFRNLAKADRSLHLKKKKMKHLLPEILVLLYAGISIVLVCVGSWISSSGTLSGAHMVSFLTSLVLLVHPIKDLGKAYNELKQGEPAVDRIFELAKVSPEEVSTSDGQFSLDSVTGDVKFINVSFQYMKELPMVLRNLNWHVRAGETVAIVGPSGGGKTTLAKLLLRLYEPNKGAILFDDHDITSISLKSLRKCIALVPQDAALFAGSIVENIAYGDPPNLIDFNRVENAAKSANADTFIRSLPNGYNTIIGQCGSTLSGGQKQRLSIARAIYHDPSILILDEATSALDNNSEILVRDALEHLMADRTVIVIAHRLDTIRKADRICLLDRGQLIEEGTHSSLLAKGGHYAKLYAKRE